MITAQLAKEFTDAWINAWNTHNLQDIMSHYADEIEFRSPMILLLKFNDDGVIRNLADLHRYFYTGLQTYPDLQFNLHNYLFGTNTLVINYTSVNGRTAAEVFELNSDGKAVKVNCNYTPHQ